MFRGNNQFELDIEAHELVVDNFAGGGGASTGIEMAIGRQVDIAINHDPDAIAMHKTNHPLTMHYCESVWDIDPIKVCAGRPVGLAWFSPDCKHFSKAAGGKPLEKKIRGLAWVAMRWAALVKPRIIMLENVEEFVTWGPVIDGRPCQKRKGQTFNSFVRQLRQHGYKVEWRELIASDYGCPTIRKRFFLVARNDGKAISFPTPTHGNPKKQPANGKTLKPWKTAADIIDWSIPCKSIFNRDKPLAEKTMQRIAKGIQKFVIDANEPFIAPAEAMIVPFITEFANASSQRNMPADEPLRTICAQVKGGHFGLVTSHMIKMRGTNIGFPTDEPVHTITAGGNHIGEVRTFLMKYYGQGIGQDINQPLHTIRTGDCFGLVMVRGEAYQIIDIGLRMLEPHELFAAQSFPSDYIIEVDHTGKKYSKAKQVARCGNSVPPLLAAALVSANYQTTINIEQVA
ncbi:DNA cytosine methyltransferase [Shewanella baltica]|uniref:DNA cytosine methyltransferase n=1 Tax=Shewanella baltica TaxID=62322 RepID=UPI00217D1711|nr:DNA cytosine methyltransferase [Shewanella baltica]MCS6101393.1 DNA cytosine methyltransferase [Shewanella baltica]MCS6184481.1 DNA cytosine methyltransferase [Shewanella baltica]